MARTTARLLPDDHLGSVRVHFEHASKHMRWAADAIFRADYEFALQNLEEAGIDLRWTRKGLRGLLQEDRRASEGTG